MHEYATVSSSSYDPASLATKLNEKSAEGWDVVAIVPTGGDVTAFLSRAKSADSGAMEPAAPAMMAEVATPSYSPAAAPEPEPEPEAMAASEPAGWAVAPEPAAPTSTAPATVIQTSSPMAQIGGDANAYQPAASYQPGGAQPTAATPSVPAGWYADPAGRFELRYWDGGTWTEHVSRAGQQYTDAPVA
jgi:hypothetical protein